MQNQNSNRKLCFRLVTPAETLPDLFCDSVRFSVSDGKNGGGGQYGVRPGHAAAVFALNAGTVTVSENGKTLWEKCCAAGFVRVEKNTVTVVTEQCFTKPGNWDRI